MRTPRLKALELIKQLKENGFIEISQVGSHIKLFNPDTRLSTIVPIHKGKNLPIGTIKSIEKQSQITFT